MSTAKQSSIRYLHLTSSWQVHETKSSGIAALDSSESQSNERCKSWHVSDERESAPKIKFPFLISTR